MEFNSDLANQACEDEAERQKLRSVTFKKD